MERQQLIMMVEAVQQGKEGAAGELYDTFYEDIYYHIFKTVKDSELAADLTQDTFIEILEKIDLLREPAAFVTWSKQIAYHKCTAYFRKRRDLLVNEDEDGNSVFDTISEDREEFIPDEALDKDDLKKTIHAMIDSLPEEQRSALLLRYFNEVPVKDIAKIQSVTEGTVKSRLNYARKAIKQAVESYEKKNGVKLHSVGAVPVLLWLFREYRIENGISLTEDLATEALISYGEAVANGAAAEMPVDSISSPAAEMNMKTEAAKTSVSSNNLNGTLLTAKAGGKGILRHITRTAAFKAAAATAACVISVGSIAGIMHLTSNENAEEINSEAVVSNESVENELIEEVGSQEVLEETVAVTNMLLKGEEFNELIFQLITDDTLSLSFTNTAVPEGVETIDVSALKDGSAVAYQNGTEVVVTTGDGDVLYANEDCSDMFDKLGIVSIKFENFNTINVKDMHGMFRQCKNLQQVDLTDFDTSNVIDMGAMFQGCESIEVLDLSGFNTSNVTRMSTMFSACMSIEVLDLSNFDTSNVTDMSTMFSACYSLKDLDISSFNTSNVTFMRYMFAGENYLEYLDLSAFDVSNVVDMESMFYNCKTLKSVNLSSFDTTNVNNMKSMFHGCESLESLDLSSFNTLNVSNMSLMFLECRNLETLDLSNFNTSKVEDMGYMFNSCYNLKILDLSNFDISAVKSVRGIFQWDKELHTIYASDWTKANNYLNDDATENMFGGCGALATDERGIPVDHGMSWEWGFTMANPHPTKGYFTQK